MTLSNETGRSRDSPPSDGTLFIRISFTHRFSFYVRQLVTCKEPPPCWWRPRVSVWRSKGPQDVGGRSLLQQVSSSWQMVLLKFVIIPEMFGDWNRSSESVRTRCALWFSGGKTSTSRLLRPSERTVSAIDHAIIVILLITRSYWKRKSINFSTWFYQLWSWQRGLQISRTLPPGPRNSIHLPVLFLSAGARWRSAALKNRKCWNVTISASSSPAGTLKTVFRLLMPTSEQIANHVDVITGRQQSQRSNALFVSETQLQGKYLISSVKTKRTFDHSFLLNNVSLW